MDTKFDNYKVADITDKELNKINELEDNLKNKANKDIIAYEDKEAKMK